MFKADYVVVGGGITGVCAAYHLAKRGCDVLLIERGELAPDAPISSSGEHAKAFRTIYGKDRTMTRLCVESLKLWRDFEIAAGTELFVPSGMLVFGADQESTLRHWANPECARYAVDSATVLQEEGLSHELLRKGELTERYPQIAQNDFYDHAILDKTAGFLHARKAVREIGRLAKAAGAVIWDHTPVEDCVREGEKVTRLITSRGDVQPTLAVIFAAGYMNGQFAPELTPKTQVTEQQILFIKPREAEAYSPRNFPIVVNINQWRYVFPIHGPGITKIADDDKYRKEKIVQPGQKLRNEAGDWFKEEAKTFLRDYVPGLLDSEPVQSTTCRYTNTVRENYLIYRRGNAVVISACSGHGFKNGPMTGLMAVELAGNQARSGVGLNRGFDYEHADNF